MISRDWMVTWWWLHDDLWELKGDLRLIWWRIWWWFDGDCMVISWKKWCIGDCFWVIFVRDLMVIFHGIFWLVVDKKPSEKWWSSSVGMMAFPIYGKNKKCSKAPTRYFWICSEYLWTWQKISMDIVTISMGMRISMMSMMRIFMKNGYDGDIYVITVYDGDIYGHTDIL